MTIEHPALIVEVNDVVLVVRQVDPTGPAWGDAAGHGAAHPRHERRGDFALSIEVARVPGWLNKSVSGIRIEDDGSDLHRVVVEQPIVSGSFSPSRGGYRGAFIVGGEDWSPVDGIMSLGLALAGQERGDLLLHASAVERDGRAWLFLGGGGSGKTTIAAELNTDRATLSVDKTLVSTRPDGLPRVHGTPFGQGPCPDWRSKTASVAGVFFLRQSGKHEVVRLSRWEATQRLLRSAIVPSRDLATWNAAMETIGRLVDLDTAHELSFRRDEGFWPLIDAVTREDDR